ncbi:Putative ABC transporter permease [Croceitalea dokdonensis DOKDO 023]|uniref:Putative ABC transporter permease n=1 Tax=Croceitalea dokdonensis DOKDO 023 TaxID=1300341 RepID=A0A0P7A308_9FLAO|nr:ABC transporter permease [Croceitalea dokdonensis]KPM30839.1 Putative ABC transporter permease [Croceitalea dokdonensis DOKDO 023]
MFKNYLKITWRNLVRNKSFSVLNILGLSIGLAVTGLILLWVNFEVGFDQFHEKKDRIYQVYNKYNVDGEIWTWNSTPKVMASVIEKDYPEVEEVSRYFYENTFLFSQGDKNIKSNGTIVDPSFLEIFSFPLIEGNIKTVLEDVNSLVVTETFAEKMFGNQPAVGQVVKMDNADTFKVTGVLKDLPNNTEFNFEYLIPWAYLKQKGYDDKNWSNNSIATYILLKEGTNYTAFSEKIETLREAYDKEAPDMVTYLYPHTRTHLYSEFENGVEVGGLIDIIRLFMIIAIIVLIIACINFMNLSTARSEKRAKEVGVRKVVGARKKALVWQFLGESVLISLLAAVVALAVIVLALPSFSTLIDTELRIDWSNPLFWGVTLSIILFTGLLAGSYPALYLSAFKPSAVLKGTFNKINTLVTPRKILVIVQFSVAIILITATIVVKEQISSVQNRKLGYNKEHLIYVQIEGDVEKNYASIKSELLDGGIASSISKTNSPITESWSNSWNIEWPGKSPDNKTLVHRMPADDAIVKTMGLQIKEGRDFDLKKYPTDSTAIILNESAVTLMGFDDPLNQIIKDNGLDWHVIGVVEDFVFNSPFQKIEPMVFEGAKAWFNMVHIKFNADNSIASNLASTEKIFKKYNPNYPFNYDFVDQDYAKKFVGEQRFKNLASLFTVLIILISCLGLFGLASYMAQNRIKEIGVRKVLGASVSGITTLLSKDFLKLVGISLLIAIPISWYAMNQYLQDFAYRIELSWWMFGLAGLLALFIAFITVSYQAIKAAKSNPAKSLRTE